MPTDFCAWLPARSDDAIAGLVCAERETATAIFLRAEGLHPRKSLSTALRMRRRALAARLEALARRGVIQTAVGEDHPVPVYWR